MDKFSEKSRPARQPDPAQVDAFAGFWQAYPRHEARQDALKAWMKLAPCSALTAEIMTGVKRYAETVKDSERKYIKLPAPWLNGRRWEDEPAESQTVKEPIFANE